MTANKPITPEERAKICVDTFMIDGADIKRPQLLNKIIAEQIRLAEKAAFKVETMILSLSFALGMVIVEITLAILIWLLILIITGR